MLLVYVQNSITNVLGINTPRSRPHPDLIGRCDAFIARICLKGATCSHVQYPRLGPSLANAARNLGQPRASSSLAALCVCSGKRYFSHRLCLHIQIRVIDSTLADGHLLSSKRIAWLPLATCGGRDTNGEDRRTRLRLLRRIRDIASLSNLEGGGSRWSGSGDTKKFLDWVQLRPSHWL